MEEIEIKLAPVLSAQAAAVFADSAIAPFLTAPRHIRMRSQYFDTPAGALAALHYTLRLRREDGAGVCAFKAPGADGARLELEVPADTLAAGLETLRAHPELPQDARPLLAGTDFTLIAGVSFTRTVCVYQRDDLRFELCFDEGQLENGVRTGGLSEMELELISGDRAAMAQIADELCARHGLSISTVGKKSQALALLTRDTGRAVSPFFVSSELLNYCIKMGWLDLVMDEQKQLHYHLTESGASALPQRFGVNFGKPCAFAEEA